MTKILTSWKGIKKGTKFKVISNSNCHNYPLGIEFTLAKESIGTEMAKAAVEFPTGNTLDIKDVQIIFFHISRRAARAESEGRRQSSSY